MVDTKIRHRVLDQRAEDSEPSPDRGGRVADVDLAVDPFLDVHPPERVEEELAEAGRSLKNVIFEGVDVAFSRASRQSCDLGFELVPLARGGEQLGSLMDRLAHVEDDFFEFLPFLGLRGVAFT